MAGFKFSWRFTGVALFLTGFAASCAQMLGGVEIDDTLSTGVGPNYPGDGGPPAPAPPPVICEQGLTECDGPLLQLCTAGGTAWLPIEQCATAKLCEATGLSSVSGCVKPTCEVEQMSCSETGMLRLCNPDQNGWVDAQQCETPAHCNAANRQCLPSPCEPKERRCNVGRLERCLDTQLDWTLVDECETNLLCEATLDAAQTQLLADTAGTMASGAAAPATGSNGMPVLEVSECINPVCLPGGVNCDGGLLLLCNPGRTAFEPAEQCATNELCAATLDYVGLGGRPRCRQPICNENDHRCTDTGILQVCTPGRDGYQTIETCLGPQFCNATEADQGRAGCLAAACDPGDMQCNGAQVQVCRADQTGFDAVNPPCATRGLCNDDDRRHAFCEPEACQRGQFATNEFQCNGASLLRCNDQHTGYEPFAQCATPGLCDSRLGFNGCKPEACRQGSFQCQGDFLAACNADRTAFDPKERCQPGGCDAGSGHCADPCIEGAARCNAQGQIEECRNRLLGWEIGPRCLSPQLCDATARTCRQPPAGCTADGQRRCRAEGANTILEVCTAGRSTFARLDSCSGAEVCDVNDALCDACRQGAEPTCQGNQLVSCSANGQQTIVQNCDQGCQVVNGPDRCRSCALGAASCDGAQLVVCQAGAVGEVLQRENCDTGGLCQATLTECNSGRTGQACRCKAGCLPTEVDCQGNQPLHCSADRTGLVPFGPVCTAGLCDPDTGACDLCHPGDKNCLADGTMQGCSSDGSRFESILRPGTALCLSPAGDEQRCAASRVVTTACDADICLDGVGCVDCDANDFDRTCVTSPGRVARTECVSGEVVTRDCQAATDACSVPTCTNQNGCNTALRCDPRSALPGCTVDGRCVECIQNGQCSNGKVCNTTTNRCVDCLQDSCTGGTVRACAGGVLSAARACGFPGLCNDAGTACLTCDAARDCSRSAPDVCTPPLCGATGCSTASRCGANQICNTTTRACEARQTCVPGTPRCDGTTASFVCNATGTGEDRVICNSGVNAGDGVCIDAGTCNSGTGACVGPQNNTGRRCDGGGTCQAGRCVICSPNQARCSGATRFVCNGQGTAETSSECPPGAPATCFAPGTCNSTIRDCVGPQPQSDVPCAGGGTCEDGVCEPPVVCTPGCDGTVPLTCNGGATPVRGRDCADTGIECVGGACNPDGTCRTTLLSEGSCGEGQTGTCQGGKCEQPVVPVCTPGCDGDVALVCINGVQTRQPCAAAIACRTAEACNGGRCETGDPINSGVPCIDGAVTGTCDENGECIPL